MGPLQSWVARWEWANPLINAIATIASAAPLLGLLGTVIGMIEIFGSQSPGGTNPQQLAHGPLERLTQPLVTWSAFTTLPMALARGTNPAFSAAIGQFLVIDAAAYRAAGGHTSVAGHVVEGRLGDAVAREAHEGGVEETSVGARGCGRRGHRVRQ